MLDNGDFKPGLDSLVAQAEFVRWEMESNKSYARTKKDFLGNPNIDSESAARILGENYIRWAINNPVYSDSGQNRRRGHLASLEKQLDANPNIANKGGGDTTPIVVSTTPIKPPSTIATTPTSSVAATPAPTGKTTPAAASGLTTVAFSPNKTDDTPVMMRGVEAGISNTKPTPTKTAAAVEAAQSKDIDRNTDNFKGLAMLAKEQLRYASRQADTLDDIYALLNRMESKVSGKPATTNQPPPRSNKTPKEAPIDLSRVY